MIIIFYFAIKFISFTATVLVTLMYGRCKFNPEEVNDALDKPLAVRSGSFCIVCNHEQHRIV